jgi:hypothetical protein
MRDESRWIDPIVEAYPVPEHIAACASAIRYDLMHGPSWSLIPKGEIENFNVDCYATLREDVAEDCDTAAGDIVTETYTGPVADALRAFIDDLPSELWIDTDCGFAGTSEPEGEWITPEDAGCEFDDETGKYDTAGYETDSTGNVYIEPYTECVYHVDGSDIIRALFGKTIANEFH